MTETGVQAPHNPAQHEQPSSHGGPQSGQQMGPQPGLGQPTPGVSEGGEEHKDSKRQKEIKAGQDAAKKHAEAAYAAEIKQAAGLDKLGHMYENAELDDENQDLWQQNTDFSYINISETIANPAHRQAFESDATKAEKDAGKKANEEWAKRKEEEMKKGREMTQQRQNAGQSSPPHHGG
jgi:hypothetical protein